MSVDKKLKEITDKIVKEYQPEKIILFGSYAWGKPGPDSDVDLFVVKETEDTRKTAREIDSSIRPRPFPIDLIVYSPRSVENGIKNDFFVKKIITQGRVLYAK